MTFAPFGSTNFVYLSMQRITTTRHCLLLLGAAWLVCLALRLPQITRPLSKHHELNSAAVLICLHEWNTHGGPKHFYGTPIQFFLGSENRFPQPATPLGRIMESGGYFSVGPGSYVMPWIAFQWLNTAPSSIAINLFNAALHAITLLILFFCIRRIFLQNVSLASDEQMANRKALICCLLYLSMPAGLWFHANAYNHEVAVIPFFTLSVYAAMGFLAGHRRVGSFILLFSSIAAAVFCDWLGVFTALGISVYFLMVPQLPFTKRTAVVLTVSLAAALAAGSIFWSYSSYLSRSDLIYFFTQTGARRTGIQNLSQGLMLYTGFLLAGAGLTIIPPFVFLARRLLQRKGMQGSLILVPLVLPPLLHTIVFFSFSAEHDYSILKWMPALALVSGGLLTELRPSGWVMAGLFAIQFAIYAVVNPPGKLARDGEPYARWKQAGEGVRHMIQPNEYLLVADSAYRHQLAWYCRRNYLVVRNQAEAVRISKTNGIKQGLLLLWDSAGRNPRLLRFRNR